MAFTDQDLETLKAYLHWHDKGRTIIGQDFIVEAKLQSLLARLEAHERLDEWLEHSQECIRTMWCAGQPTAGGGYEEKFGDKWYQSKPIDKTPKCTCGLDKTLEAWRKAAGRDK